MHTQRSEFSDLFIKMAKRGIRHTLPNNAKRFEPFAFANWYHLPQQSSGRFYEGIVMYRIIIDCVAAMEQTTDFLDLSPTQLR